MKTTTIQLSGLGRGGTTRLNPRWRLSALWVGVLLGLALPAARAEHGIAAGLLKVDQLVAGNNSNTNVAVTPLLLINDFRPAKGDIWTTNTIKITNIVDNVTNIYTTNFGYYCWNTADFYVQIGSSTVDDTNGVLISSVAQNGRTNTANITNYYPISFVEESFGATPSATTFYYPPAATNGFRICTQVPVTNGAAGNMVEVNVNVAGAWFPFNKYIGGWARNSGRTNGGSMDLLRASPQVALGVNFIEYGIPNGSGGWAANDGTFGLNLTNLGINSQTDGILLVNHAKDEGNFALSKAEADGTWTLYVHDGATDSAGNYEQDPIAFVYVPRTNTDVVSGKVNGDGTVAMYSGAAPQFTVSKVKNGCYALQMNNYAATNGVLLISAEGGGSLNLDNAVSYQISTNGLSWEVQSRDTPWYGLQSPYRVIGGVSYPEPAFSFVFIPAPAVGFVVTPTANLITTESGGSASFAVQLNAKPSADVIIPVSSSDTAEGTVNVSSLTFNTSNWFEPQTVTVTGVDDAVQDGEVAYTIVLGAATSADARFNGLKPSDVSAINVDNELGITVSANNLVTTEDGGTATFTVVLNSAPTSDVTIALSSSDTIEGTVSPASLTFTPGDWSTPQTVTATGVDDSVVDGNAAYTIVTAAAVSADANYNGLNPMDVSVVNIDNDSPGLRISPTYTTLSVSESGTTAEFTVALNCQPAANVAVSFVSSDTTEGTVSPASRTFTAANWSTPQTFTLAGVDDYVNDGTVSYALNGTAASSDAAYNGLTVSIPAQTADNEAELTLPSGTLYYGIGWPGLGIDGQATISDTNKADYSGGSLTVTLTANGTVNDRVEIRNTGSDYGQIGVSGATVTYSGTAIGTFSGGAGATPLVVTFNSSANPEAAQALARNVTYRSVTNTPLLAPRTVAFALADGDGGTSTASKQIVVSKLHISDFAQGKDSGFGTYNGGHDCEVYSLLDPGAVYPGGSYLDRTNGVVGIQVHISKTTTSGYDEQMLLRFDDIVGTNAGWIPTNAILVQADLMMKIVNSGSGSPLYRMLIPWDDPVSWDTLGSGVQIDGFEAETNSYSQIGCSDHSGSSGTGDMSVSVLPDVQAWVTGISNYGWVLPSWGVYTNNDATIFCPAESTNIADRPHLRVTWLPGDAGIQTATFRQGVNGYSGAVDTQIRQINPTNQYSTSTSLGPDYEVTSGKEDPQHALLRFDNIFGTGSGQIPPLAKIHAAVLDLTSTGASMMGDGGTINRMLIPWAATNTWNYFGEGIDADGVEAAATPTASAGNPSLDPNAQGGYNTFDVTTDVQSWANGTNNYGWVFLPWIYGGDGWFFYSSDYATVAARPQLRIYYSYTAAIMQTPVVSGGSVQVKFKGEIGTTYTVWRRADVASGTWTSLGTATVDESGTATYTDAAPLATTAFYRVSTQ